jgi:putative lipoprotein
MSRTLAASLALGWALAAVPARAEDDPWLGRDKAYHYSACTVLGAGGYGLSSLWWTQPDRRALFGGGLAIGVGALKEAADAAGFGDPSWRDFTWDVAGAITGVAVAYGVDALWTLWAKDDAQVRREGVRVQF